MKVFFIHLQDSIVKQKDKLNWCKATETVRLKYILSSISILSSSSFFPAVFVCSFCIDSLTLKQFL